MSPQPSKMSPQPSKLSPATVTNYAWQAYLYAFPLVLMSVTRTVFLRSKSTSDLVPAPKPNQFSNTLKFVDASDREVVRPNVDTLYSLAWLDLSEGPLVLDLPRLPPDSDRYYLLPILDAWTNVVASIGTRTLADPNAGGRVVIAGPRWKEADRSGVPVVRVPTDMAWIIGRTETKGPDDYNKVHAVQAQYRLHPLVQGVETSRLPLPETAPSGSSSAANITPPDFVIGLASGEFFSLFAHLLVDNPSLRDDTAMVAKLDQLGLVPGRPYGPERYGPEFAQAFQEGVAQAQYLIRHGVGNQTVGKWTFPIDDIGDFGTDYFNRARIAWNGLGANITADAIYPVSTTDDNGQSLTGKGQSYSLRFERDELPPVKGFWSVTVYERLYFYDNPQKIYALHNWDTVAASDGSVTITLSYQQPTGPSAAQNWLPIPAGPFNITMRLYWPLESVLAKSWTPPALTLTTV